MATMPRGEPRSVPDPAGDAYDESMRRKRQSARTSEAQARQVADSANLAGDVLEVFDATPAGIAAITKDAGDLQAARFVSRFSGPIGAALSTVVASAGFKADRAAGMPLDEAIIKHAGGLVLGTVIGAVGAGAGAVVGAPGGPGGARLGASVGGYMGQKDGGYIASGAAHAWRGLKEDWRDAKSAVGGVMTTLNDPEYWVNRSRY